MKVLYVGYFKTGSKTMNEALGMLGYQVSDIVRHFVELRKDWQKFHDGKGTADDIQRMYEGYEATGDAPAFIYWKDFLEAFPDLKFILTYRDADSWLKSWKNQVEVINKSDLSFPLSAFSLKAQKWFDFADGFMSAAFKSPRPPKSIIRKYSIPDDKVQMQQYSDHIENVKKNIPTDQLLIFDIMDGWQPLCDFLGVEVPDCPFPRANKGGEIIHWRLKNDQFMLDMYGEMYFNLAIVAIVIAFAAYVIFGLFL